MLDRLLKFEEQLVRLEALLLVVFVLLMLALATYNVFYRNVLVPIQVSLITSPHDPKPAAPATPADVQKPPAAADDSAGGFGGGFGEEGGTEEGAGGFGGDFDEAKPAAGGDEAGGFGGDFDEAKPEAQPPAAPPADEAGGFGGDFDDSAKPADAPKPTPEAKPADAAGGFGGDFAEAEPATEPAKPAEGAGGFGGDFGDAPSEGAGGFGGDFGEGDKDPAAPAAATGTPEPAPTPEAPAEVPAFAKFVDAVKLEWIDVLLRQLVLIVGFLGAMMATQRRKHITIDALSKVLPVHVLHWAHVITNAVSIVVCILLAKAGADLVAISLEYPKELMAWADEWEFQLAFPVGFGMLVIHFTIRLIQSLYYATGKAEPPPGYLEEGGVA